MQRYFGSKAEQQPGKVANQVEQANGVTRMMQQCTAMLRDRMGDEACTPLQINNLRYLSCYEDPHLEGPCKAGNRSSKCVVPSTVLHPQNCRCGMTVYPLWAHAGYT